MTVVPTTATTATTATTSTAGGVNPGAAAVAGAAAASNNEEPESTDWGWVAFAILAFGLLVGGLVWWWRGRHKDKSAGAPS